MISKIISKKKGSKSNAKRLINYISKRQDVDIINMNSISQTQSIEEYIDEVVAVQSMNQRSQSDKNIHLVLSFHKNDNLNKNILIAIENEIINCLELQNHQRISAYHNDTDHPHLHIAINGVNPDSFTMAKLSHSKRKIIEATKKIELKFELQSDNQKNKIEQKKNIPNGAKDIEAQQGELSLFSHIYNISPQLKKTNSWNELQKILAKNGIKMEPQYKGLVFTRFDGVSIKASRIKGFGKPSIEKKLGKFQESSYPLNKYVPAMQTNKFELNQKYWDMYLKEKQQKLAQKEKINALVREKRLEINTLSKDEYQRIKNLPKGVAKRALYSINKLNRLARLEVLRIETKKEKPVIKGYADWLVGRAFKFYDLDAHRVLISRKVRVENRHDNNISGEVSKGINYLKEFAKIEYKIKRNGDVIYTKDDIKIIDRHIDLHINKTNNQNMNELYLKFAMQKYGKSINLNGDNNFKNVIIETAIKHNIKVDFTDQYSKEYYQSKILHNTKIIKSQEIADYFVAHDIKSVEQFIQQRNNYGETMRLVSEADINKELQIKSIRKINNGQYVLVLNNNLNDNIIYPTTQSIALKARREKQKGLSLDKKYTCGFIKTQRNMKR